ncbi:MAG: asparagine synthase (glutamine-hydrolyzing) [Cyanobacteria bacterium HKST-UBA03]|nr:asparagine synthase (glutamine-hydrolyzing) [Cyanobacteria bacterium HKST-UBA03]
MCGIAGFLSKTPLHRSVADFVLHDLNERQKHRGPDGHGFWVNDEEAPTVGFGHVRLSIVDLDHGAQPMADPATNHVVCYNGEIYNYIELRQELGEHRFTTASDTEVILKAYETWGPACVEKFRGMFAFALWDAQKQKLFIARDRFGIKPFYFTIQRENGGVFLFASELKTLVPYCKDFKINLDSLRDYFTFQFCLGYKTLADGVNKLMPAHCGYVDRNLNLDFWKYWEVEYDLDWNHTDAYFKRAVRETLHDSVGVHLRADVEVGAYVSGGIDSSLVASMAYEQLEKTGQDRFQAFVGKFTEPEGFDESQYAQALADERGMILHQIPIGEQDFVDQIAKVIYHLDEPLAGPGSFPQFMVSKTVRQHLKVVLGGQGGDEIFGGYTRYLIAYFEQCIKGAIDGTISNGNYIVTYESIIPALRSLKRYQPLLQEFWSEGIFEDDRDKRYFRLVNRSNTFGGSVDWGIFNGTTSLDEFRQIFWGKNVGKESYFDSMTHFDFKTLLPALLQVEDRMSMAHSIESRVPFLDHHVVELAASIPSNIKFKDGELKRLLRIGLDDYIPDAILNRKDKMGFPVPLPHWLKQGGAAHDFVMDTFKSKAAQNRFYFSKDFDVEQVIATSGAYSRNLWAFLSLELWQQQFLDCHDYISIEALNTAKAAGKTTGKTKVAAPV